MKTKVQHAYCHACRFGTHCAISLQVWWCVDWCSCTDTICLLWTFFFEWTIRCIRLHCKHPIIPLLQPRFFSIRVKCAINICWMTENHPSQSLLGFLHCLLCTHTRDDVCVVNECTTPLHFLHVEQTDLFIFWSNYAVYLFSWEIQQLADWVIVTHHTLNSSSQEPPERNESTNRTIPHADEYAFVPASAFFPPTIPCDFQFLSHPLCA